MTVPTRFLVRVRIRGELAPAWSTVFGDLAVAVEPDGTTLVHGELADQAAVHGLLGSVRDLGLSLVSLETVAFPITAPLEGSPCRS